MNDEQRTTSSETYFQHYRDKIKRLKDMVARREELDTAYQKDRNYLSEQMRSLNNEIGVMRRVITRVVDEGIDPTTARIMMDESYTQDLWSSNPFREANDEYVSSIDLTDLTIGSITTSTGSITLGPLGAIGASGPSGAMGPSYGGTTYGGNYSAGANGPGGPYVTCSSDGDA